MRGWLEAVPEHWVDELGTLAFDGFLLGSMGEMREQLVRALIPGSVAAGPANCAG